MNLLNDLDKMTEHYSSEEFVEMTCVPFTNIGMGRVTIFTVTSH